MVGFVADPVLCEVLKEVRDWTVQSTREGGTYVRSKKKKTMVVNELVNICICQGVNDN